MNGQQQHDFEASVATEITAKQVNYNDSQEQASPDLKGNFTIEDSEKRAVVPDFLHEKQSTGRRNKASPKATETKSNKLLNEDLPVAKKFMAARNRIGGIKPRSKQPLGLQPSFQVYSQYPV